LNQPEEPLKQVITAKPGVFRYLVDTLVPVLSRLDKVTLVRARKVPISL
jgi:hypothetical protein